MQRVATRGRQAHRARISREQDHAKLALKGCDTIGDGGLRRVETLRGPEKLLSRPPRESFLVIACSPKDVSSRLLPSPFPVEPP